MNSECARFGLIFNRYRKRPSADTDPIPKPSLFRRFLAYVLHVRLGETRRGLYFRAAILLFLFVWSWWFVVTPIGSNYPGRSFMHYVNLPFHEAGHASPVS